MTEKTIGAIASSFLHNPPLEKPETCEKHGPYTAKCYLGSRFQPCPQCQEEQMQQRQREEEERAQQEAQRRWSLRLRDAQIPERFKDRTLSNFEVNCEGQQDALNFAKDFALEFNKRHSGRCAIFLGERGTGKTHLACGIAHYVTKIGQSAMFTSVSKMVRRIREAKSFDSDETESQAIKIYTFPDLLILDEIGLQSGTDAEARSLFDVLNDRYEQRLPTILLSNLDLAGIEHAIGPRLFDRLREDGCQYRVFDWPSARGNLS
jgi:DNA replication protein DnaC